MNKFKGIGKAAFAVGFAYTAGKFTFLAIEDSCVLLCKKFMIYNAKRGVKAFKDECDKRGIDYEEYENKSDFQMGFHA